MYIHCTVVEWGEKRGQANCLKKKVYMTAEAHHRWMACKIFQILHKNARKSQIQISRFWKLVKFGTNLLSKSNTYFITSKLPMATISDYVHLIEHKFSFKMALS